MRPAKHRKAKAPPGGIAKKVHEGRDKSLKRTHELHHVLKEQGTYLLEMEKELPAVQHSPAQRVDPLTKIKLQLFPIDEVTRLGLQKDGHHPYLELTLKARKRISSVLKHLQTKWGSSTIATGEPVLYPYSIQEARSSPDRWTLDDKHVTAGDVHAAIGSPALFRLRYGWFSNAGSKSLSQSSELAPAESLNPASFLTKSSDQHEGLQKGCESNINNKCDEGRKFEQADSEVTVAVGGVKNHEIMVDNLVDHPVDQINTLECNEGSLGPSSEIWTDSLTNISIGGLLSEASLQGMFSSFLSKTNGSVPTSHPSQCTSDSFDALITTHVQHSQSKKLSSNEPCSSILDAEDTCMAFPFKKSSMSKDVSTSNGSRNAGISCLEIGTGLKAAEDDIQIKIEPDTFNASALQESETTLQLCSRVYNDESSLGLAGIKWTDTLGPFDLGLPSGKVINGDSISISGFVR